MNVITPVDNTNNIRLVDFIRIESPEGTYRMNTGPANITIPEVDAYPFLAVGTLMAVGDVQRDIKSTANDTTVTLTGIDTSMLGFVLSQNIKGSAIQMWHGFYNENGALITTGGTGGLYQFFNGYVNSFAISEQWLEEQKMYVGTISVAAASVQLILQSRISGRYTNDNSWQFSSPGDTSMNRVPFIQNINYYFGKDAPANS